jgi:hypothetical protein
LSEKNDTRREFIRHTIDVPLEVETVESGGPRVEHGINVSHGGLAFETDACLQEGATIRLRIPTVNPPFEATARVAWCRPEGRSFLVGVQFTDAGVAFRSRMVQQVCSIENYRKEVLQREGRQLTSQAAAAEWIDRYAGRFPESEVVRSGGG